MAEGELSSKGRVGSGLSGRGWGGGGGVRVPRVPLSHTPKINLRLPAITAMRKGITSRSVRSPLLNG